MLTYSFAPSDRCASTVHEFLAVCQAEPELAAEHLALGYFEPWLLDTGHAELAAAAAKARRNHTRGADGLAQFLRTAAPAQPKHAGRKKSTRQDRRLEA